MRKTAGFIAPHKYQDLGRWHITRFVRGVAEQLPAGTLLLDAGAGECAYRPLFAHCRYLGADLAVGESDWNYRALDLAVRLERLPLRSGCLDAVLCTQALEHLEWPRETMAEFHRVLRPGGRLFLTAPMAHCEHQVPHDYFRYTSFGLRSLCERAGFVAVEVAPFGGLPMRLAYELPRLMELFPAPGLARGRVRGMLVLSLRGAVLALVRMLQRLLVLADRFDRSRNDPFGWAVMAER
jgi:SAM-dependent methyltransferase